VNPAFVEEMCSHIGDEVLAAAVVSV